MVQIPTEIAVFISSPADVEHERLRAERVIERLNGEYAGVVRLKTERWETRFYEARSTFQAQIPEAANCDLVIGILWSRLGSELPPEMPSMPGGEPYPSGTAYEILTAIEKSKTHDRPRVYLFRKTADASIAIDDEAKQKLFSDQLARLRDFWGRYVKDTAGHFKAGFQEFKTPDDFERQLEALLRGWLQERILQGRSVVWPIKTKGSPFCGLAAFGAKHAPVFFGRGSDVTRAVDALKDAARRQTPFLLLIGPSGSGKSSLARAGLLPRITTPGVVPAVDLWRVATMRPGERKGEPTLALAIHLFDDAKDIPAEEQGRPPAIPELAQSSHGTPQALAAALGGGDAASVVWALDVVARTQQKAHGFERPVQCHLLLLIDQLDELFANDVSEEQRERFARALAALVATSRVWIVATLRTDLYERLQQVAALLALKQNGCSYDLGPPNAGELAEIVRKPAEAAGLTYSRDAKGRSLDEQLLEDAGRPDMLPMLQFALQELFDRHETRGEETLLTFAAYEGIGGLDGAIDKRAEEALGALGEAERAALPRLLRQLAVPTRERGGTAGLAIRSVPLTEAAPDRASSRLVQALVDARILLSSGEQGQASVRLAHERVLRSWKRAAEIVRANADFYRLREDVEDQRQRWHEARQSPDLLIPAGLPLEEARKLIDGHGDELDVDMTGFIRASLEADDRRMRAKRFRNRLAAAAAVIFALVAAVAGWQSLEAYKQKHAAEQSAKEAEEQKLVAERNAKEAEQQTLKAEQRSAVLASNYAKSLTENGFLDEALLVMLNAARWFDDKSVPDEISIALWGALEKKSEVSQRRFDALKGVEVLSFSKTGDEIIALRNGAEVVRISTKDGQVNVVGKFDTPALQTDSEEEPVIAVEGGLVTRTRGFGGDDFKEHVQILDLQNGSLIQGDLSGDYRLRQLVDGSIYVRDNETGKVNRIEGQDANGFKLEEVHLSPAQLDQLKYGTCMADAPKEARDAIRKEYEDAEPVLTFSCTSLGDHYLVTWTRGTSAGGERIDAVFDSSGERSDVRETLASELTEGLAGNDISWIAAGPAPGLFGILLNRDVYVVSDNGLLLHYRHPTTPSAAAFLDEEHLLVAESDTGTLVEHTLGAGGPLFPSAEQSKVGTDQPIPTLHQGTCVGYAIPRADDDVLADNTKITYDLGSITSSSDNHEIRAARAGKTVTLAVDKGASCIQFSGDGKQLLVVGDEVTVYDFDRAFSSGTLAGTEQGKLPQKVITAFFVGHDIVTAGGGNNVLLWKRSDANEWTNLELYRGENPTFYAEPDDSARRLLLLENRGSGRVHGLLYSLSARQVWFDFGDVYKWFGLAFAKSHNVLLAEGSSWTGVKPMVPLSALVDKAVQGLSPECRPTRAGDYTSSRCWPASLD